MTTYKNLGRDSDVAEYEYGVDYIEVKFKGNWIYLYTNESAGSENIKVMKKLADKGEGLNEFIMRKVKKDYSKKWKV